MRNLVYLCLLSVGLFTACSAPNAITGQAGMSDQGLTQETTKDIQGEERKLIYEASLDLVVQEPDVLREPLAELAKTYGGYMVRFSPETAAIRVKSESLNEALEAFHRLGKVKNKRVTGEDITEAYVDTQIRLENAQKVRKRYLDILEKAKNVEEILKIERELARINEQIDLLTGKLKAMNQKISLSLIEVRIVKKIKMGPLGYVTYGLFKGVSWLFVRK